MVMSPVSLLIASMAIQRNTQQPNTVSKVTTIPTSSSSSSAALGRREFGLVTAFGSAASVMFLGAVGVVPLTGAAAAHAFDGSGSSASSGYNPATKAEKVRRYKQRIVADVRDFNRLGQALSNGEAGADSKAWVNFFIAFQRREPDEFGRTFAALVDLRGLPTKKKYEYEGGDGLLLATSFTKPGKPSENTPAVKSWNKVFKTFDAIEAAGTGKKGDAAKARAEWEKTKPLLEQYLADVELPGTLSDPIYN
jgi:hypothetical protein